MLKIVFVLLLSFSFVGRSHATYGAKPGEYARYGFLIVKSGAKPSVQELTVTIGPVEDGLQWWDMSVKKPDGATFIVKALSEHPPMVRADGNVGRIKRYMLKDGDRPFLEYGKSKDAFLPVFDFRTELIPLPTTGSAFEGDFACSGKYIGNCVQLLETGRDANISDLGDVKSLTLDDSLLVGTGRPFRDIDEGRVVGRDYKYRGFTLEEYDELEASGFNLFLIDTAERESFVRERSVFYHKYPNFDDFPAILYRSNYRGPIMFTDEPAVLTEFAACRRPSDAANFLKQTVLESITKGPHYSPLVLAACFEKSGVSLGTWNLLQPDIPAWEAVFAAAYYEMEAGVSGVIHEGRYQLDPFNQILKDCFGPDMRVTSEELLAIQFAFLRGAARCFHGSWGTSIYGQADPAISPLAFKMAYDTGARYLWFWTCDNGHHVPYAEQLALARGLKEHAKAHPRASLDVELKKVRVAIALPEGYLAWSDIWPGGLWKGVFGLSLMNPEGVSYGLVTGEALRQCVKVFRQGHQFDVVSDSEPARKAGYRRYIRILADGTVKD